MAVRADRTRVGIVGGSLGGLFAAVLLHRAGHDVTLFERSATGLERRGAGLVAQQEIFELLTTVGRAQDVNVGVVATERITLDRSGRVASRDPSPQTQISWDHVYEVLRALLPADRYRLGSHALRVEDGDDAAGIHFADGSREDFDLVVGADGLGSVVRKTVAPADHRNRYVGYVTWRGLVPESILSADTGDVLLGRFAFYNGPGVHMLGYLVPGVGGDLRPGFRRYNWVWYRSLSDRGLTQLMQDVGRPPRSFSTAPGELPTALRDRLVEEAAHVLPPPFADVVDAESEPFMQAIYDYVAPRMAGSRVALLGDAAAVVRPHTAMGAAKAAGDALALAAALRHGGDVSAALAAYNAQRLPVAQAISRYGQQLAQSLLL